MQEIIVTLIVAAALFAAIRRLHRMFTHKDSGCNCCPHSGKPHCHCCDCADGQAE